MARRFGYGYGRLVYIAPTKSCLGLNIDINKNQTLYIQTQKEIVRGARAQKEVAKENAILCTL